MKYEHSVHRSYTIFFPQETEVLIATRCKNNTYNSVTSSNTISESPVSRKIKHKFFKSTYLVIFILHYTINLNPENKKIRIHLIHTEGFYPTNSILPKTINELSLSIKLMVLNICKGYWQNHQILEAFQQFLYHSSSRYECESLYIYPQVLQIKKERCKKLF